MMKSFFKKLAFVMALAMVVSAMAPAATAKAAETKKLDICLQDEPYTAVRTELTKTEGDAPVDLKFAGAPTDWRTLGLKWDSSNKAVATVDQTGLVTILAAGTTDITIAGGDYAGKLVLTVDEKVEVPAYEVKQTAADKLTITWADAKNATDAVEVYKVYKLTDGNKEVKWPCETVVKDGVATVTVKYGGLEDGADYVVKFGTVSETVSARVGNVTKIEVNPVAYQYNNKGEMVDAKGLYVSSDDVEYLIRFDVTYITDNDIEFTTRPADTDLEFEVLEGGDDIYLDDDGVGTLIYEKGAWAHIVAKYTYSDDAAPIEYDFFIEGVEPEVAKFAGITKYTLVSVDTTDAPNVNKADTTWNKTDIIVDDRAYVAVEITDTLGASKYLGLKDKDYNNEFGEISFLSANEGIVLVGNEGLVTPVQTGTTSIIVQLASYDAEGELMAPKPIYAFDITVDKSRAVDKVTASDVTVLTGVDLIDSKKNVEISVVDNYGNPWKGWTATITTDNDAAPYDNTTVTDDDNDGKAVFEVDGSQFPANTNYVTYKATVDGKFATIRVTLKDNKNTVSGYRAEVSSVTVDGKKSGIINGEVTVYSYWKSGSVEYKLKDVTNTTTVKVYDDAVADFWTKNTENLNGKLVVTVKNPGNGDKYTAKLEDGKIVIPGVANVDVTTASGGALTVTEGTYEVTVTNVKNVKLVAGAATEDTADDRYEVTRKSVEDQKSFTVTNAAKKIENVTIGDAEDDGNYYGYDIKDLIAEYAVFKFHGDDEYKISADKIVDVDCIKNEDAGKVYVKTIKVKVPVFNPDGNDGDGEELNCFFEQTLTINKLLPCELTTW